MFLSTVRYIIVLVRSLVFEILRIGNCHHYGGRPRDMFEVQRKDYSSIALDCSVRYNIGGILKGYQHLFIGLEYRNDVFVYPLRYRVLKGYG
jgi:hypothetical protein